MMHQVYRTLPDDRPITSIHVVEDPEKCPNGFVVVSRTHDQDSDADLWREGSFFGRKATRYICLSKTEGINGYIVESLSIINEKDVPPDGYSLLTRTLDSEQKAWRKRQLCYRLSRREQTMSAVTDIIVLSKMKKAPEGFAWAGDINGMTVCFKVGNNCPPPNRPPPSQMLYSLTPNCTRSPPAVAPRRSAPAPPPKPSNGVAYPALNREDTSPHEYERLISPKPMRPAPMPPGPTQQVSYATIASYQGLEGVPFVLNTGFQNLGRGIQMNLPTIKTRTKYQLDREFEYDFRTERQT